jgi:hypothetical protein
VALATPIVRQLAKCAPFAGSVMNAWETSLRRALIRGKVLLIVTAFLALFSSKHPDFTRKKLRNARWDPPRRLVGSIPQMAGFPTNLAMNVDNLSAINLQFLG